MHFRRLVDRHTDRSTNDQLTYRLIECWTIDWLDRPADKLMDRLNNQSTECLTDGPDRQTDEPTDLQTDRQGSPESRQKSNGMKKPNSDWTCGDTGHTRCLTCLASECLVCPPLAHSLYHSLACSLAHSLARPSSQTRGFCVWFHFATNPLMCTWCIILQRTRRVSVRHHIYILVCMVCSSVNCQQTFFFIPSSYVCPSISLRPSVRPFVRTSLFLGTSVQMVRPYLPPTRWAGGGGHGEWMR